MKPTALVMAAGEGTRMRSSLPKMLHPVCGRPLVAWPIAAAMEVGADRIAVITSPNHDISPALADGVEVVVQPESDGTGGALRAALPVIRESETVLVLSGDVPLVSPGALGDLLETHAQAGAAATMLTVELDDPGSYGRVVRDGAGQVERVVETKAPGDATPDELRIREVNAGIYAFAAAPLADALGGLDRENGQGEYYLPDVLPALRRAGLPVHARIADDEAVTMGVNDRLDLARVEAEARRRIIEHHLRAGVTVVDPACTWIDADVRIGADARIEPGTLLKGTTEVGVGAVVGPHSTLVDTVVGERASVVHSFLTECEVLEGCTVGPFAHIRPQTVLEPGAKAGSFVELKAARVGAGTKVPHLSYVGDAEVGEGSNLGAGTITANYDGFRKHRTVIGDHVRIGVDTMLIAPVQVGDSAYTGAGAVVKEDVPPGSLAVSANDQRNIEGYAKRKAQAQEGDSA